MWMYMVVKLKGICRYYAEDTDTDQGIKKNIWWLFIFYIRAMACRAHAVNHHCHPMRQRNDSGSSFFHLVKVHSDNFFSRNLNSTWWFLSVVSSTICELSVLAMCVSWVTHDDIIASTWMEKRLTVLKERCMLIGWRVWQKCVWLFHVRQGGNKCWLAIINISILM